MVDLWFVLFTAPSQFWLLILWITSLNLVHSTSSKWIHVFLSSILWPCSSGHALSKFSQIWQYSKCESWKNINLPYCRQLRQFLEFFNLKFVLNHLLKIRNLWQKKIFTKYLTKIHHQKNHCMAPCSKQLYKVSLVEPCSKDSVKCVLFLRGIVNVYKLSSTLAFF